MASIGPNNPTAAISDGTAGVSWDNLSGCFAHDASRATASLADFDIQTTDGLVATGFNMSIPEGATINGIIVGVERKVSLPTSFTAEDEMISLVKDGATPTASNYAIGGSWPSADVYNNYGGAGDLWGTTWSVAEINSANFGVYVQANLALSTAHIRAAQVNHIRITVYYTLGASDAAGANMMAMF